eukprot:Ihof_evm5s691 gene=Ihof_evmTU5s691
MGPRRYPGIIADRPLIARLYKVGDKLGWKKKEPIHPDLMDQKEIPKKDTFIPTPRSTL